MCEFLSAMENEAHQSKDLTRSERVLGGNAIKTLNQKDLLAQNIKGILRLKLIQQESINRSKTPSYRDSTIKNKKF